MCRLWIVAIVLSVCCVTAEAQSQDQGDAVLTPESFVEGIQGDWKLESLIDRGRQLRIRPEHTEDDLLSIDGSDVTFIHNGRENKWRMEDIAVHEDLVHVTLVMPGDAKETRFQSIVSIDGDFLVIARGRTRPERPNTIEPTEDNLVRTWRKVSEEVQDSSVESQTSNSTDEAVTNRQLLERIEQLENRIAELEARAESQRNAPFQAPRPLHPDQQPAPPNFPEHFRPLPPREQIPHGQPLPGQPLRRLPLERDVPESWQRFEFNGQHFYIIPVDETGSKTDKRR